MKIGFFGGSFDPIHLGHLKFAEEMRQKYGLDQIWFSPARISPFKLDKPPNVSDEHRLAMLKLALEDHPHFKIYDKELTRDGPSFTVDTLKQLAKEHPEDQFFLLVGEDTAKDFLKWRDPEKIKQLAQLIVGERSPVSSTLIRERLKNKIDCKEYLSQKIIDYILLHHLYL